MNITGIYWLFHSHTVYRAATIKNIAFFFYFHALRNGHVDVFANTFLCFQSADGSAENQMIVESDDFNRQLYPSLLYKCLRTELIYSYFLQLSTNIINSCEIKTICSTKSILLWSSNPGGPIVPSILFFLSSNYHGSLDLAAAPWEGMGRQFLDFEASSTCLPFHLRSLQTLLASPADQRHLVKSRHFNQGYLLDACPPWSAGMWTQINSTLETLKVEWSECLSW